MHNPILENKKPTIDLIISRIGTGCYQWLIFMIVGWFWFTDGGELIVIGVITKVLEKEWNLSSLQVEMMGAIIYLGMIIGTITIGSLGDKYGRRSTLVITSLGLFISGVLSGLMPGFWSFVACRFVLGACMGGLIPGATATLLEVCTVKTRGFMIVMENFVFQLGTIALILLAMWLVPDLKPKYWRELLVLAAAPGFLALVFLIIFLDETPRYLANKQRHEKAIQVMDKIARYNRRHELDEEEKQIIRRIDPPESNTFSFRIKRLFGPDYRRTTLQLFFAWFSTGFVYYGLLFILPRTISSQDHGDSEVLRELLTVSLIQLPTSIIPSVAMEVKKLGRKNTLLICSVIQFLGCLGCTFIEDQDVFQIIVAVVAFFDLVYFDMVYPFTSELFDTTVRGTGFALCSSWARLAGFVSPFILLELHNIDPSFPYGAMAVISFITIINCWMFKNDTTGVNLDNIH